LQGNAETLYVAAGSADTSVLVNKMLSGTCACRAGFGVAPSSALLTFYLRTALVGAGNIAAWADRPMAARFELG
jgi:hypothetical protein